MPLHQDDPRQLGPFRLSDRVASSAEGVVFTGRDSRGRAVSVAMLAAGAGSDAAARERFAEAVRGGRGVGDAPEVLASSLSGSMAWVAVRQAGSRGAEAYLEPVSASGAGSGNAAAAPAYAPHWAGRGTGQPAAAGWSWASVGVRRRPGAASGASWPVVVALLVALLLFAVLVVAVFLLLQNYSTQAGPPPAQPSSQEYTPGSTPPSPQGSEESGEGGQPQSEQPTPVPTPSEDVPSVDVDEDDYPAGDETMNPGDQA